MSDRELEHLIKMINQIADNIAIGEGGDIAANKVADHIKRFWAPRMKQIIIRYGDEGGEKLVSPAKAAILLLKKVK